MTILVALRGLVRIQDPAPSPPLVVKHTNVVAVLQAHCSHSSSVAFEPTTT